MRSKERKSLAVLYLTNAAVSLWIKPYGWWGGGGVI